MDFWSRSPRCIANSKRQVVTDSQITPNHMLLDNMPAKSISNPFALKKYLRDIAMRYGLFRATLILIQTNPFFLESKHAVAVSRIREDQEPEPER